MLVFNWRRVVRRAWSFRLALIAAGLGGAELLVQYLTPAHPSRLFLVLAVIVNLAAAVARIVAQPKLYQQETPDHERPESTP